MPAEGFLENIYLGSLDERLFDSFRAPVDEAKIGRLMEKFQAISQQYAPQSIEELGRIPQDMLQQMREIGMFGISIPVAYGGLGFNLWEYLRTVEEMVKQDISVVLASLAHLSIGTKGILLFGNEQQKQKYLVPAASGEMIFSYALTEPKIGSDAQHIETRAELSADGSHYILTGQKTYITNANYAGALTTFAQLDPKNPGHMGAFIVETAWEGVKIGRDMPKMGLKASSTAAIRFEDVRVPVANLLGKPGDGFKIAMIILNYGRLGLGAASVGMMKQSVADMLKRSSSRVQFGGPIQRFPLIQEKIVKARVNGFVSSALDDFTAGLLDRNPVANVALESSHCKLFGTTRCWDTLYDALQVAGGSGYLSTQPYEKRMRDFRVTTVFEGTTEIHSIYPALFMIRRITKDLKSAHASRTGRLFALIRAMFKSIQWPLKFPDRVMNKASKAARANAVLIRRMLILGIILYGEKVVGKQFFLRKISTLSLYLFGLLTILAKLRAESGTKAPAGEDLQLLNYFLLEAKKVRLQSMSLFDTKSEKLVGRIMRSLTTTPHG
ncbi:acyl-CoA dehydrogenase family protein [Desulfoferrobacter suflitae]|uniref:acyl-CoA dehydrogenase family protein n=1 Tax=Desulfoferrobacter suflitae TaxID=2865782 RepID=UPI0021642EDD|nr:acyl-CoA dehydrogenase family protein [Desulfoferrobacter suflitae]MCK8601897.1 acyl-CoA dehydrogenase family protein [Desulfoferrobacter suflitae]